MVLFINTNGANINVVPYNKLSDINVIEIEFKNKSMLKDNLLELITNFMDSLTTEEEKFLLVINDLDDAFMNLNNLDETQAKLKRSMFRNLIETYIGMGHEIIYFSYQINPSDSEILELDELDGFEIITNEVKLYNKLIKNIK